MFIFYFTLTTFLTFLLAFFISPPFKRIMKKKSMQESSNQDDDTSNYELQMISQDSEFFMNCYCTPNPSTTIITPILTRVVPQPKRKVKIETVKTKGVVEPGEEKSTSFQPSEDNFTQFGNYVANKLRNMKRDQTKFAEKLISEVLFEADMGNLNRKWKLLEVTKQLTEDLVKYSNRTKPRSLNEWYDRATSHPSVSHPEFLAERMAQGSKDRAPNLEVELVPCSSCGRTFVPDRIEYHERVCKSRRKEPREPYDSVTHRWKGTDNEPAIKWIKSNSEPKPPREVRAPPRDKNEMPFPKPAELIEEPIPAVVKPDGRIECPGCKRSFEETAANRHIPGCTARAKGRSSR